MGNGLGHGHALECQLAGGLPERNGGLGEARSGEMMGQDLRFGGLDVRETLASITRAILPCNSCLRLLSNEL